MELRPYRREDAERCVEFFGSAARADATLEPVSSDAWKAHVGRSVNRGGRDFVVAVDGDRVVGVLLSSLGETEGAPSRTARIIVHPTHRRRGIAARLADRLLLQDDPPSVPLHSECVGAWDVGIGMLRRRGFSETTRTLWMSVGESPAVTPAPAGLTLRPYDGSAADDAAWTRLNDEGYLGTREHSALHAQDLAAMRAGPGFALWFADDGESVVGLCHVKTFGDLGCVNSLVVTPARRSRGLGRALLTRGLATLRETHEGRLRLSVRSENAPAVALYRSLGFTLEDTITDWWLDRSGNLPPSHSS